MSKQRHLGRRLPINLTWQKAFYTLVLFLTFSSFGTLLQSWFKQKELGESKILESKNLTNLSLRSNSDFPQNGDFQSQLGPNQRIVHVLDDISNTDHCVFYNFFSRSNTYSKDYEPVTLALHSTIDYAEHLVKHAEDWEDVISYALYLSLMNDEALPALAALHKCHESVNQKVSIHLVWNRNFLSESCEDDNIMKVVATISENTISCDDFELDYVLPKLKVDNVPLSGYPINVMRNEARRGATTKLHLVGDIETRFSPQFATNVRSLTQQLLNDTLGKAVLVYRRFDMDDSQAFPASIQNISNLLEAEKIVQTNINDSISNLQQWLNYSLTNDHITFDNVSYTSNQWKPQFIMRHDSPFYYEHVQTRMKDHQFLCYELCRAGYSYLLMSHVYNIHPGIKSTAVQNSIETNGPEDVVLEKFISYINARYPVYRKHQCPSLS